MRDRIWFPYAHTAEPIPHLPEIYALDELFDRSYPNHDYVFEPQSRQYLTLGDLWGYLYLKSLQNANSVFLPLTLEMGSCAGLGSVRVWCCRVSAYSIRCCHTVISAHCAVVWCGWIFSRGQSPVGVNGCRCGRRARNICRPRCNVGIGSAVYEQVDLPAGLDA